MSSAVSPVSSNLKIFTLDGVGSNTERLLHSGCYVCAVKQNKGTEQGYASSEKLRVTLVDLDNRSDGSRDIVIPGSDGFHRIIGFDYPYLLVVGHSKVDSSLLDIIVINLENSEPVEYARRCLNSQFSRYYFFKDPCYATMNETELYVDINDAGFTIPRTQLIAREKADRCGLLKKNVKLFDKHRLYSELPSNYAGEGSAPKVSIYCAESNNDTSMNRKELCSGGDLLPEFVIDYTSRSIIVAYGNLLKRVSLDRPETDNLITPYPISNPITLSRKVTHLTSLSGNLLLGEDEEGIKVWELDWSKRTAQECPLPETTVYQLASRIVLYKDTIYQTPNARAAVSSTEADEKSSPYFDRTSSVGESGAKDDASDDEEFDPEEAQDPKPSPFRAGFQAGFQTALQVATVAAVVLGTLFLIATSIHAVNPSLLGRVFEQLSLNTTSGFGIAGGLYGIAGLIQLVYRACQPKPLPPIATE